MTMADTIQRNAETQNLYREVNERVAEVNRRFAGGAAARTSSQLIEVFCECGRNGPPCNDHVTVTAATYERIRADATTFVLHPGHGEASVEQVIERGDGFLIARNFGHAAAIARAADPRRVDDAAPEPGTASPRT
jgi:hypothetical protein